MTKKLRVSGRASFPEQRMAETTRPKRSSATGDACFRAGDPECRLLHCSASAVRKSATSLRENCESQAVGLMCKALRSSFYGNRAFFEQSVESHLAETSHPNVKAEGWMPCSEAGLASAALFLPSVLILEELAKCWRLLAFPRDLPSHAQNFFSAPALQAIREDLGRRSRRALVILDQSSILG